jgi:malonate-semialdehyde dehydrogenase (acetylating) / methylmalonate-semialdehyde dehydrogenase
MSSATAATTAFTLGHWIDGKTLTQGTGTLALHSPIDGTPSGHLPLADAAVVEAAVRSATDAFAAWSRVPVKDRVQVLYKFKEIAHRRLGELAACVSRENGKTEDEAAAGVLRGLEVVEFACGLPTLMGGELLEVSTGVDCYTRRYPLGVTLGITPFNFPAMVPLWMFPMAIGCGNAFILKPSEQTPASPLILAAWLRDAGLPDGIFSVVQGGRSTVESLLDHPGIAAAAFVGSTPAAKAVFLRGTNAGKRMLTLGGAKNHVVILPDADPALVAKNLTASATGCAGQRCMAASVALGVGNCDSIIDAIAAEMRTIRAGHDMGAIISPTARDRILGYIDAAESSGALLLVDGRRPALPPAKQGGNYVGATLIDHLLPGSPPVKEEIFGPVLSILRVDCLDEALHIENTSPYGNAASIYTASGAAARHFEQHAHAGMIGINIGVPVPRDPFGFGGWNASKFGHGDITGRDAVGFWTRSKKTTVKWSAPAAGNWMS